MKGLNPRLIGLSYVGSKGSFFGNAYFNLWNYLTYPRHFLKEGIARPTQNH